MRKTTLILLTILILFVMQEVALSFDSDDTYVKIQEMMNDLGAPPERAKNNGRVQKCVDGGTKKITVKKSKGGTTYEGIYNNCREYGRQRDGRVSITVGN